MKIVAPWTPEQVESLNAYQGAGVMHPFTCGNDSEHQVLLATPSGWICRDCDYRQNWARDWMADWRWRAGLQGEMHERVMQAAAAFELPSQLKAHLESNPLTVMQIRTHHPEHYELLNTADGTRWVIQDGQWHRVHDHRCTPACDASEEHMRAMELDADEQLKESD